MPRAPKKKDAPTEHIDLNLRIKNDGGPVFTFLSGIPDPYARGDRVRQLLYAGLMLERGMVGVAPSFPRADVAPVPPPVVKAGTETSSASTSGGDVIAETVFEAGDLLAIFGTETPHLGA